VNKQNKQKLIKVLFIEIKQQKRQISASNIYLPLLSNQFAAYILEKIHEVNDIFR